MIEAIESEQALIGCAIFDAERSAKALEQLAPEHFLDPGHQAIWGAIKDASQRGRLSDPVSIFNAVSDHPAVNELGGLVYLADMVDRAYLPSLSSHIEIVADTAMRRHLEHAGRTMAALASDRSKTAFDHIADAERHLTSLLNDAAPSENNLIDARSSALATLDEIDQEASEGRAKGAMTGLRCFDMRMRGLRPGWLVILAGRPSMGKTALARCAALGTARKNPQQQVVFFALEMARRELDERTLSQLSFERGDGIAYKDMNGDTLPPEERRFLRDMAGKVPANLIIDDSPVLSVDYVRRRVLSLKRKGPIAAVFIDYLQIMRRPAAEGRNEASVVGEMTRSLKELAREANICVVLLSQINRGVENRDDKRPQMSDLRESGAIEQDANAIFFPYREVYYLERQPPKEDAPADKVLAYNQNVELYRRRMDVICAKVRQGAVGEDRQEYYAEYDCIRDVAE